MHSKQRCKDDRLGGRNSKSYRRGKLKDEQNNTTDIEVVRVNIRLGYICVSLTYFTDTRELITEPVHPSSILSETMGRMCHQCRGLSVQLSCGGGGPLHGLQSQ